MINFKRIITIALSSTVLITSANAATLKVSYSPDTAISFEGNEFSSDAVILTVIPKGEDYTENTEYAVIRECNPVNGNFSLSLKMPQSAKSGYYEATVYDNETGYAKGDFFFCNPWLAKDALASLKCGSVSSDELKSVAKELGIESDFNSDIINKDVFISAFNRLSNESAYSAEGFSNAYIGALLLGGAKYDFDEFSDTLKNNAIVLGCEKHSFMSYSQDNRKQIFENISNIKGSSDNFADLLTEASFITLLDKCQTKEEYQKVVFDEFASFLNLNTSDYKSLKLPTDVIMQLMAKSYNSVSDFKSDFSDFSSKQKEKENNKTSSSSSSSSSGGGGFGGFAQISYGKDVADAPIQNSTPQNTEVLFDDIKQHWAKDAVLYLKSKNIIDGVGDNLFAPEKSVTRAEFAKMIARSFLISEYDVIEEFNDVTDTDWFAKDVYALSSNKIINGLGDGSFAPFSYLTRQDAALIMMKVSQYAEYKLEDLRADAKFADSSAIAPYAFDAVNTLYRAKLINGVTDNEFSPLSTVTRAQAAQMIYNLLSKQGGTV